MVAVDNPVFVPPTVVMVAPQLGVNIGSAARAMMNFGLRDLRLIAPREGWPNPFAVAAAAGAGAMLEQAAVFDALPQGVGDCHLLYATTARDRRQNKRVIDAEAFAQEALQHSLAGRKVGVLFGRERVGLENDEIALCDAIVTLPVDEAYPSLNVAQAVMVIAYEWRKAFLSPYAAGAEASSVRFQAPHLSEAATRDELFGFFDHLDAALAPTAFYRPDHKKDVMARNLKNIFHRLQLTKQDIRTLHGVVRALVEGELDENGFPSRKVRSSVRSQPKDKS